MPDPDLIGITQTAFSPSTPIDRFIGIAQTGFSLSTPIDRLIGIIQDECIGNHAYARPNCYHPGLSSARVKLVGS